MTLFSIITGTPFWVWILLAFVLYRGFKNSRPRRTTPFRPLILPGIMFAISLVSRGHLSSDFDASAILWAGMLVTGGIIGAILAIRMKITVDPGATGAIYLPGSWASLVLVLIIFSTHYVFGVIDAITPALAASPSIIMTGAALRGLFTGIFLGRGLMLCWRAHHLLQAFQTQSIG